MKRKAFLVALFFAGPLSLVLAYSAQEPEAVSLTHQMTILILQLAIIVIAARLLGFIFKKYLKQPKVLGELVAGMLIGPYALGQIHLSFFHGAVFPVLEGSLPISPELYGFAVVASIVLLFLSGLETDLPTFIRFSGVGTAVGLGGVVVSFTLGDLLAVALLPGVTSFMDVPALFLGTISTATSVGITARILSERRKMSSPEGVTILAAAVLDDVIGIVILAVVVGIAKISGTGGEVDWGEIGIIAAKAFGFWIGFTLLGILVAPVLAKRLKQLGSMEVIAGISFGLALLMSGLAESAGLAMIIGAYVTGLSLSQTDIAHDLREKLEGLNSFLVPIFFCSMGMMVNFPAMKGVFLFGLIFAAVGIFSKIVGCGIPALFTGFNLRGAMRIGAGMLPRGEVTLIVAGIGLSSGSIREDMFGVAIMTMLIASIIAPPVLIKSFSGGTGYTKKGGAGKDSGKTSSIELEFPTPRMVDFLLAEILESFREEEFFVHQLDRNSNIYHIRKDNLMISITRTDNQIVLNTRPEDEEFVRLLMLEELLKLKDLIKGLEYMKSPDTMGADLLKGLFDESDQSKS